MRRILGGMPDGTEISAALLWDLDNVTPGYAQMTSLARSILTFTGPSSSWIAAGHPSTVAACRNTLEGLGIVVLSGGRQRDGADKRLLRRARHLRRAGVRRFWVASNDRGFARLTESCDLTILTLHPALVSRRLLDRASALVQFSQAGDGWTWRFCNLNRHGLPPPA